jgi:hypothetical protein
MLENILFSSWADLVDNLRSQSSTCSFYSLRWRLGSMLG